MIRKCLTGAALAAVLTISSSPIAAQRGSTMPSADQLPEDTTVFVHVDVRRMLRVTGLDKMVRRQIEGALDELREEGREARKLVDLIDDFDLDPTRDLHAVTVFGNEKRENFAVMLTTSEKVDRVFGWLKEEGASRSRSRDGVDYLTINAAGVAAALGVDEDDVDGESISVAVRRQGDMRRVIIAENREDVLRAARAFDGDGKTAADRDRILAQRPGRDVMMHAEIAASFADLVKDTPASGIASRIKRVVVQLAESNDEVSVSVNLHTGSRKDAESISAVLNGLRGLLHMVDVGDEVPEEILDAVRELRAEVDGKHVEIRLTLPADQIRDKIRENLGGAKIR